MASPDAAVPIWLLDGVGFQIIGADHAEVVDASVLRDRTRSRELHKAIRFPNNGSSPIRLPIPSTLGTAKRATTGLMIPWCMSGSIFLIEQWTLRNEYA